MLKQYETVFIATPVLSEQQMKEAVAKYTQLIKDNGGEVVYEEDWGLRQLAYPIQHKTSGFYYLIQFKSEPTFVEVLETQYYRDERIIRYLTVALDKDAVEYAERRRQNRSKAAAAPQAEAVKEEPVQPVQEEEETNEENND
jgi:small subunit ribosomal protein S6